MSGLNGARGIAQKAPLRLPEPFYQVVERGPSLRPWIVASCRQCPIIIGGMPSEDAAQHWTEIHTCPQNTGLKLENHAWDSQNGEATPSYE